MMSKNMQKVYLFAKKYNESLLANDARFRHVVHIIHEEGSVLFFKNAFCIHFRNEDDDWILVFTEHHGFFVYPKDDLMDYNEYAYCAVDFINQ